MALVVVGALGSTSGSSSSSGSDGSWFSGSTSLDLHDPFSTKLGDDEVTVSDEYCMYNATETESSGCKKPRTCSACLRVTGCMLNSTGYCVSTAHHYNQSLDFRSATLYKNQTLSVQTSYDYWNTTGVARNSTVQNWIIPSTAVNYCDERDRTCQICRLSVFPSAKKADMRFCVSTSGCICTAQCDSPGLDRARHRATVCDPFKDPRKALPQSLMWVIGSGVALCICLVLYWWMWRRTSEKSQGDDDMCNQYGPGKDPRDKTHSHGPLSLYHRDTPIMELGPGDYTQTSMDGSLRRGESS